MLIESLAAIMDASARSMDHFERRADKMGRNWYPTGTLSEPFRPVNVTNLDMAFPASVGNLMPPVDKIPDEYCGFNSHNKWNDLVTALFFTGVKDLKLTPKDGIDPIVAMRHIRTILGSYEPKHEYKEAACAFLLSEWFEDAKWERK
jgi:hypothetical protein